MSFSEGDVATRCLPFCAREACAPAYRLVVVAVRACALKGDASCIKGDVKCVVMFLERVEIPGCKFRHPNYHFASFSYQYTLLKLRSTLPYMYKFTVTPHVECLAVVPDIVLHFIIKETICLIDMISVNTEAGAQHARDMIDVNYLVNIA